MTTRRTFLWTTLSPILASLVPFASLRAAGEQTPTLGITTPYGELRERSSIDILQEFADYGTLGITWLRMDVYWADVQRNGPDSFDWAGLDRIVGLAQQSGLRLILIVGTVPAWARIEPEHRSPPKDPQDYANFVATAVARFSPRGIKHWELWNEPNLSISFPPEPSPAIYAEMLKAAYQAVKQTDPESVVLIGGLAPVAETDDRTPKRYYAADKFLEELYALGAGGHFDLMSFHPYSYPELPSDGSGWNGWTVMTGPIQRVMKRNGDGEMPIWITEFGAPANSLGDFVSEARQTEILSEGLKLAPGAVRDTPLFLYSYQDRGTNREDREDWFGLRYADGSPKASYKFLKELMGQ